MISSGFDVFLARLMSRLRIASPTESPLSLLMLINESGMASRERSALGAKAIAKVLMLHLVNEVINWQMLASSSKTESRSFVKKPTDKFHIIITGINLTSCFDGCFNFRTLFFFVRLACQTISSGFIVLKSLQNKKCMR